MHHVFRANQLTCFIKGQLTLVDIEGIVTLNKILWWVGNNIAIGIHIECNAIGVGRLDQIIDFWHRTHTQRYIVKTKAGRALHLNCRVRTSGSSRESKVVVFGAVSHSYTANCIAGRRVNNLVNTRLQRFGQRGANIGCWWHFNHTVNTIHRNVENVITSLAR